MTTELLPGATPQSAYRESLIASILVKPFLIYGAEVCQSCGEVKTFHGWAGAMATHRAGEFVCHDCRGRVAVAEAPSRQELCEVCRGPAHRSEAAGHGRYVCRRCRPALRRARPGSAIGGVLDELSRRRNLERRTTRALETLDLNSEISFLDERRAQERALRRRRQLEAEASARLAGRHAGRSPDA
ncbi:MAG: hypothetical protein M3433_03280 [Actinomycetota bacterium]|nr:hypothetical protein [Actinomycetota bacterium]